MSSNQRPIPAGPVLASVPSCALDSDGLRQQGGRLAALAPSVVATQRGAGRLEVTFAPDYDRELLEEALAVERECCPFFSLSLDESARRLTIAVSCADHEPALAALADQLGVRIP